MGLVEQIIEMRVREAEERIIEDKNKKFATDLLRYTGYSVKEIAFLIDVPDSFVEKIKESQCAKPSTGLRM